VLLVPVLWAASRLLEAKQWLLFALFIFGQLVVNAVSQAFVWRLHDFWWVAPSVLALCLLGIPFRRK
jgi:hypothetical protein